jgi:predicted dehydrogenase
MEVVIMERLRMGVLGCSGHYALRIAVPLRGSLLVEPWGVASRDGERARRYAGERGFSKFYGSYEALLADGDIDFVYIPLPNHLHLEYIRKAAMAGKPVLCEKPLGLNAGEAVEAAEFCRERGVPLMEAFMYRLHPQWVRAKELADADEIGQIRAINCFFSYNNRDAGNIRNIAACGGGALLDIGCYAVSSARYLMKAEPLRAFCTLLRDPVFKTDVQASGVLDFGGGRASTFTVGTQMYSWQRVTALGTGGSLSIEVPFNMYGDVPGRVTVSTGVGQRRIETEIADQYLLEFDAFAEALINKTGTPIPVEDAVANMAALDALFASAASGRWEEVRVY